jgi:hypothetical protein
MSTEREQARLIAERIAQRMSSSQSGSSPAESRSDVGAELASVRESLSELQKRLTRLEARLTAQRDIPTTRMTPAGSPQKPVPLTHSPWLAGVNAIAGHPSQERFGVEEAAVSELVDYFEKEKICSVEPGGKPCDHCAMCSSRGF